MDVIENLVKSFSKLPGFGPRSAKRAVLYLLKDNNVLTALIDSLADAKSKIINCEICGNLDTFSPCSVCNDIKRTDDSLCIVENIADMWALIKIPNFKGKFHILGGVLSPLDGVSPEDLNIPKLLERIKLNNIKEVIIATNLTMDGQVTAHYLLDLFEPLDVKVTKLANGLPVGGELDYMDDGTLYAAIDFRSKF